jgi:hypothetical protein
VVGLIRPGVLRPVFRAAMVVAFPIGWVVSHLVLALLFYGVLTPLGLFFRAIGRDPLSRNYDLEAVSYWLPRCQPEDVRRYFSGF